MQYRLFDFCILEVIARSAANILGIQPNSAALFYRKIRQVIAFNLAQEASEVFNGDIELDESYFGGVHKGKRSRGAAGKVAVSGMLKHQGKVFTVVVENTKPATLLPVMARKIKPDSIAYTDGYHSYDALDVSDFHHHRIDHSEAFVDEKNHINGIKNFWNQAKRVLRKYNGIDKEFFPLFLKECEFRFNYGTPIDQVKILRKWCDL
jgi:transposase